LEEGDVVVADWPKGHAVYKTVGVLHQSEVALLNKISPQPDVTRPSSDHAELGGTISSRQRHDYP